MTEPAAAPGETAARPALTALEPVDSLTITALVDSGIDASLPSQGPVRRLFVLAGE